MVYYLSWKSGEMPCLPEHWEQYLPEKRIKKANSYKQEKDRITCVLSYILLRYATYKEVHEMEPLQMHTDANGKPHELHDRYFYNISHCDTAVACSFNATKTGVDVQDYRPVRENVVKKVCSDEEQRRLLESGYDEKLFAAFWTGKEAYGKYIGDGLGFDLDKYSFCPEPDFPQSVQFGALWMQTALYDDFALSVCSQEQLAVKQVTLDELLQFLRVLSC